MTNFAAQIAGIATLALAALPLAAITTAAHAAPAHIRVADLNLASTDGVATLHRRMAVAARQLCGSEKNLGQQAACTAAVHAEIQEKLNQRQVLLAQR